MCQLHRRRAFSAKTDRQFKGVVPGRFLLSKIYYPDGRTAFIANCQNEKLQKEDLRAFEECILPKIMQSIAAPERSSVCIIGDFNLGLHQGLAFPTASGEMCTAQASTSCSILEQVVRGAPEN